MKIQRIFGSKAPARITGIARTGIDCFGALHPSAVRGGSGMPPRDQRQNIARREHITREVSLLSTTKTIVRAAPSARRSQVSPRANKPMPRPLALLPKIICGLVPYGEVGNVSINGGRANNRLAAGCFDVGIIWGKHNITANIDHGGDEIANLFDFTLQFGNASDHLYFELRLRDNAAGKHALFLVQYGKISSTSLEYVPGNFESFYGVTQIYSATLKTINLTVEPNVSAFQGSRVWLADQSALPKRSYAVPME